MQFNMKRIIFLLLLLIGLASCAINSEVKDSSPKSSYWVDVNERNYGRRQKTLLYSHLNSNKSETKTTDSRDLLNNAALDPKGKRVAYFKYHWGNTIKSIDSRSLVIVHLDSMKSKT